MLLLAPPSWGANTDVAFYPIEAKNGVQFIAENLSECHVTITADGSVTFLKSQGDRNFPLTFVLPPHSKTTILKFITISDQIPPSYNYSYRFQWGRNDSNFNEHDYLSITNKQTVSVLRPGFVAEIKDGVVTICHSDGTVGRYANISSIFAKVKAGSPLVAGDALGSAKVKSNFSVWRPLNGLKSQRIHIGSSRKGRDR